MTYTLVTGGAGYIGSHINKILAQNNKKSIVIDDFSTGHQNFVNWGNLETGSLLDTKFLDKTFQKYKISTVIHLAGSTYVGESSLDPQKYYYNNVVGSMNLLQSMLKHQVKNIIFSSSCTVFGLAKVEFLNEDCPIAPISPYGRTKLYIEEIIKDYHLAYDLNFCILRYFNAAGADLETEIGEWHEPETHLIPLVLKAAEEKEKSTLKVFGTDYPTFDGSCIRDYVHVTDLGRAHVKAVDYLAQEQKSDFFNLGTGQGHSVLEIIKAAEKICQTKIKFETIQRRPGDPPRLVANYDKAKNILQWEPQLSDIDTIMDSAWKWYQKLNNL